MKKRSTKPKLVFFGDARKGNVAEAMSEFEAFVKEKAVILKKACIENCTADMLTECDYAVVFGGDGTIISAARALSQNQVPVIGVNLGKLGFLAEFSVDELKTYFDHIVTGKAAVEKRMMLQCRIDGPDQMVFESLAINDVFVTAGPPFRMIELQIKVDGQSLAGCVSDGLVICTPTGSTAYNLSSGGPILAAKMAALVITPICPHSLSFRPIVISADSKIEILGLQLNEGTTLSIDGQISKPLRPESVITVETSENSFLVVNNPIRTHWDALAEKLNWAQKFGYKRKIVTKNNRCSKA